MLYMIYDLMTLLFFTSIPITAISLIAICALIILLDNDQYAWATGELFVLYVFLEFMSAGSLWTTIMDNKVATLGFIFGYFVIGAGYSTLKFNSFVTNITRKVGELKVMFLNQPDYREMYPTNRSATTEVQANHQEAWIRCRDNNLNRRMMSAIRNGLDPLTNKAKIVGWIGYWPLSAIGLFLAEPLTKLANAIYERLKTVYTNIYNRRLASLGSSAANVDLVSHAHSLPKVATANRGGSVR